jgi:putative transcriptional regulator
VSQRDDLAGEAHRIVCHLDRLLADRAMTLTALAEEVGLTVVNLSILKNDRTKAVRFSPLTRICDVRSCHPGDVFSLAPPTHQQWPGANTGGWHEGAGDQPVGTLSPGAKTSGSVEV